jgi:phage terminase large subunit
MKIKIAKPFEDLFNPKRYKVYFGGRGGAKSWAFAQALLILGAKKKLRILCTREFQGSIKESVHKLLTDTIDRMELNGFYTVQRDSIKGKNGTNFFFEGLKNNATKIKSMEGINIVWCEEAEAISMHSWDILVPTIREKGSEIWVSFNPANELDATYQKYVIPYLDELGIQEDPKKSASCENSMIVVKKVSWRDNPWFPEELKFEKDKLEISDHNKYMHVWEGECRTAVEGAIYGEQLLAAKDRILDHIDVESHYPVNTFWDLGRNDTNAIWFHQRVGTENRFIDYYECRLVGLDHYAKVLKERGYFYGKHHLPHDVEVVSLSTNQSRKNTLVEMGVKPIKVVPRVKILNDGIEMTRRMFASCYFDKEKCSDGLKALRNYQYQFDDKYQVFRETPLHNWASNGADAFRTFGQGYISSNIQYSDEVHKQLHQEKQSSGISNGMGWMA